MLRDAPCSSLPLCGRSAPRSHLRVPVQEDIEDLCTVLPSRTRDLELLSSARCGGLQQQTVQFSEDRLRTLAGRRCYNRYMSIVSGAVHRACTDVSVSSSRLLDIPRGFTGMPCDLHGVVGVYPFLFTSPCPMQFVYTGRMAD